MKLVRILSLNIAIYTFVGCAHIDEPTKTAAEFPEIEEADLSPRQSALLSHAKQDFSDVQTGSTPTHARKKSVARDGGTTVYKGDGYSLVAHRRYENQGSVWGRIVGPTLVLEPKITGGDSISIDARRFQPRPHNTTSRTSR